MNLGLPGSGNVAGAAYLPATCSAPGGNMSPTVTNGSFAMDFKEFKARRLVQLSKQFFSKKKWISLLLQILGVLAFLQTIGVWTT